MAKRQKIKSEMELPIAQDYYEVEQILNKRLSPNGMMYLIKWKGYPDPRDYTWEPIQHLVEVEDLVKQFNKAFDKRTSGGRQAVKQEPRKPTKQRKQEEVESEDNESEQAEAEIEEEEVKQSKKRGRKKKVPTPIAPEIDKKLPSNNEEEEEEEEEIKPRKMEPRRIRQLEQTKPQQIQLDKYWEKDGFELGRIHRHRIQGSTLIFHVNVNKDDLVCGMVVLTLEQLSQICEEKLIEYMENWVRSHLIEKELMNTKEYHELNDYWKSVQ